MNKIFDLVEYLYSPLGKNMRFLKIILCTIVVGLINISTLPANSSLVPQVAVSGTVTDSQTGEPMPGVNIQVSGTTIGAITDVAGKYSINVPDANAILIFSFIGYSTQEVPVAGRSIVDLGLESELTGLGEVVVTGYGTVQKQSLTGAISSIKAVDIISAKTNSVASMVQGKVPGLMIRKRTGEPGVFNSYISIRGFGTPLLVLDGVVRDNMSDFERLNPQDIESISVLKDASAAIYGMNSDNGVLIVTTKSGSKGKTKINYNTTYSWKQPTSQGLQSSVDAYTFRVMKNEMSRNYKRAEPYSAAELALWEAGTEPGYTDFNWYDATIRNGIGAQQHNLSITGGNDIITHYTSFGYMEDQGIMVHNKTNNYKKYNVRTAFDAKIAEGLTAKVKFSGKYDTRLNPPQSFFWIFKQMIVSDRGIGPYTLATKDSKVKHYSNVPAENVNVIAKADPDADGYVSNVNYQYQLSGELNYDLPFVKGLSLNVLGAYDGNLRDYTRFRGSFILYDYLTDEPGNPTQATIEERMTHFTRTDIQAKISYKTKIAEAHNISALLVSEVRQIKEKDVGGKRQYDEIFTHDILDQASATNQTTRGGFDEEAYVSYLGRINYDYRGKYLLEFAFREDGSYRYAPEKRWAFFPSGSIGWRISEESFIRNTLPMISNLKLRASYGQMGADAGNPYQYYPGYELGGIAEGAVLTPGQITLGMIPPGVVNSNLSWIETKTLDIGLDLDLWRGKLGVVVDVFRKDREGLLATRASAVPNTFGASFPQENLNSDHHQGIEFEVSHRNIRGAISYGVSANMTYSRRYRDYQEKSPYQSTWDEWKDGSAGNGRLDGREWIYRQDGIYTDITQYETAPLIGGTRGNAYGLPGTQRVVDLNGDGRISGDDRLPEAFPRNSNPPLQYGMNMFASWKGIDFNTLFQGASLFSYNFNPGDVWGYRRFPSMWSFWLDRWHQADPSVNPYDPAAEWIPGHFAPLQASHSGTLQATSTKQWRIPANYVRWKNLEIGYTIPANIAQLAFVENVRVSVNIVNVATFTKKELKKFDPEKELGAWSAGLTYPLMREFNFTLSVTF